MILHKWILISVAIEAAMLEDSMTSHENALSGEQLYSLSSLLEEEVADIFVAAQVWDLVL